MKTSELIRLTGKKPENFKEVEISGFSNDTRSLRKGEAFVAIRTTGADGNLFLAEAVTKGASAIIASHTSKHDPVTYPNLFLVRDPVHLIGEAAGKRLRENTKTRIGVTGSAGKTTTKELLAAMLKTAHSTMSTEGNFNNTIGVPLTVLNRLDHPVDYFVTEMGMSFPGEIGRLVEIVQPAIRVWLNVLTAHIGNFESIEELRDAKAEILSMRAPTDIIIYNRDDVLIKSRVDHEIGVKYSFGFSEDADLRILSTETHSLSSATLVFEHDGTIHSLHHHLPGQHNAMNVAAAILTARICGVSIRGIQKALLDTNPVLRRGETYMVGAMTVFDDCYNSNPDALKQVLTMLNEVQVVGRKIVVLGDMLELGRASKMRHREIGTFLGGLRFDEVVFFGSEMKAAHETYQFKSHWFPETREAGAALLTLVADTDTILVKASRGMKGEIIIDMLKERSL